MRPFINRRSLLVALLAIGLSTGAPVRGDDKPDCPTYAIGGDTAIGVEDKGYIFLYLAKLKNDPSPPQAAKQVGFDLPAATPVPIVQPPQPDERWVLVGAASPKDVGEQNAAPSGLSKVADSLQLRVISVPNTDTHVPEVNDTTTPKLPTKYYVELGKKDGDGKAPVVATGVKNEGMSAEGSLNVKDYALISAKLDLNGNAISSSNIADIRIVRVPLGSGAALLALGRTAFRLQATEGITRSSFESGAGIQVEIPTGQGTRMRVGVMGGPDFNLTPSEGKAVSTPAVGGAIHGGVEIPFF